MITEEEKQEIINLAVEKALLALPETVGNLMASQAAYSKMNSQFYKDHKEFVNHKQIVASVIEQIDGKNPLLTYEEKLEKAAPIIKERIALVGKLDMTTVKQPNRDFSGLDIKGSNNGEL